MITPIKNSVVVLDSNTTSFTHALKTFEYVFDKTEEEAEQLCHDITANGHIIVGSYIFEIADSKVEEIIQLGIQNSFELPAFTVEDEVLLSTPIEEIIAKYKSALNDE